jgi:hypothetical protein
MADPKKMILNYAMRDIPIHPERSKVYNSCRIIPILLPLWNSDRSPEPTRK